MKNKSEELNTYKSHEFLGDSILKFVVAKLYIEKFGYDEIGTCHHKVGFLVSNKLIGQIAKKMGLEPSVEDSKNYRSLSIKPYANAFEAHIYQLLLESGIDGLTEFIDQNLFTTEVLESIDKQYKETVQAVTLTATEMKKTKVKEVIIKREYIIQTNYTKENPVKIGDRIMYISTDLSSLTGASITSAIGRTGVVISAIPASEQFSYRKSYRIVIKLVNGTVIPCHHVELFKLG